jgi:hypothetical protein
MLLENFLISKNLNEGLGEKRTKLKSSYYTKSMNKPLNILQK